MTVLIAKFTFQVIGFIILLTGAVGFIDLVILNSVSECVLAVRERVQLHPELREQLMNDRLRERVQRSGNNNPYNNPFLPNTARGSVENFPIPNAVMGRGVTDAEYQAVLKEFLKSRAARPLSAPSEYHPQDYPWFYSAINNVLIPRIRKIPIIGYLFPPAGEFPGSVEDQQPIENQQPVENQPSTENQPSGEEPESLRDNYESTIIKAHEFVRKFGYQWKKALEVMPLEDHIKIILAGATAPFLWFLKREYDKIMKKRTERANANQVPGGQA